MFDSRRRTEAPHSDRADWGNIHKMLPYIWAYRGRVVAALAALIVSKLAMVGVPLVLKQIVDVLDAEQSQTGCFARRFVAHLWRPTAYQ